MAERREWIEVASFGAMFEAEMAAARLNNAGIPTQIKGESGMFGAGYAGGVPHGASVLVPRELESDARELLEEE